MLIAQLSDTHITIDGRQAGDLRSALAWINAMQPRPDIVLLSGDAVNNARPEQYACLRDILARSAVAVYVVPGNHDRRSALRAIVPAAHYPGVAGEHLHYALDIAPVRIIALDTTDPGRPGGILDDTRLAWLETALCDYPERPTLLFMHHPPFRTGVNLADVFGFKGLRRFEALVARHRQLRRLVAGHVHCERRASIGEAVATTCISSTPQLVPEVLERRWLGLRPEPAGFAVHAWQHEAFTTTTYVADGDDRFIRRADASGSRGGEA